MKIEVTSLRVVDCGPLKDVRIDFTDKETGKPLPVVLLAGANGSGKTTILEVMYGLAQLLDPTIEQVPSVLRRSMYAIMNCVVDNIPFSFHYGQLDRSEIDTPHSENIGKSRTYDLPIRISSGAFKPESTGLAKEIQTAMYNSRNTFKHSNFAPNMNDPFYEGIAHAPSFLYFSHQRAIEAVAGQEIRREPTNYEWTYKYEVVKSFAGSLSSYLIWLDYAFPKAFQFIKDYLGRIYADKKSFGIERSELKAVVHTANGGTHDVDKLSSGEQNLLIMLLELRRRLLPGSIVLIDELENSLHPAFQHRLAQGLLQLQREIPFQLIATTHAETFVDIFGTNATRVLPTPSALSEAQIK